MMDAKRLLCGFAMFCASAASGAEVSIRPDLGARLLALKPIYSSDPKPVVDTNTWRGTDWKQGIVYLSGVIERGDLAKLKRVIGTEDDFEPRLSPPFYVVLNSPGGHFTEAVKMGQYLSWWRGGNGGDSLGGVFVLNGEECLSACAMTFALSAIDRDKGRLERFVEKGGRLGFHMPFLPPEKAIQTAAVSTAMNLTYDVMAEYLKLIENGGTPVALAQNALYYRGANDFFTLTGGMMTRALGFDPVASDGAASAVIHDGLLERDYVDACRIMEFTQEGGLDGYSYEYWGIDTTTCAWGKIGHSHSGTMASIDRSKPMTAGLLADVLGCSGGTLTHDYYLWDTGNRFLDEELPDEYSRYTREYADYHGIPFQFPYRMDWNRTLLSNVNMRSSPSVNSGRVASLSGGASVQVTDCRITDDSQGVWFKVQSGDQQGWVSARYVSRLEKNYLGWENQVLRPAR